MARLPTVLDMRHCFAGILSTLERALCIASRFAGSSAKTSKGVSSGNLCLTCSPRRGLTTRLSSSLRWREKFMPDAARLPMAFQAGLKVARSSRAHFEPAWNFFSFTLRFGPAAAPARAQGAREGSLQSVMAHSPPLPASHSCGKTKHTKKSNPLIASQLQG